MEHDTQDELVKFIKDECARSEYKMHYSTVPVSGAVIPNNSNKGRMKRDAVCRHYFYGNIDNNNNGNKIMLDRLDAQLKNQALSTTQYSAYLRNFSFSDFTMYALRNKCMF